MNPEEVLDELQKRIDQDAMLGAIRDRIADGKATDLDSARYCIRSGAVAGKYLGSQILDVPSDAREALCVDVLHGRYKDAVKQCAAVQKAQDAKQGLHLAPQIPAFNSERAHKIGRATADPTAPDETIRRRADAPIANAAASVHDDFVRKQADFRSGAGLSCWLTRDSGSGCCPWCAEIAGRYAYGSEPKDIYARHDNCACTVTFESGRKRGGRSGRQIEHPAPDAGAGEPVRFTAENRPAGAAPLTRITAERARELAEERRPKRLTRQQTGFAQNGLTNGLESVIINYARVIDSLFYADDYESQTYTKEEIIQNLRMSAVGLEAIKYLEDNPQVKVKLSEDLEATNRGEHEKNLLTVWLNNCPNVRVAAQTLIHEVVHHKYDIGGSQLAETICFAFEKMHKENRSYLTQEEWDALAELARSVYWDYPAYGGVGDAKRFDFIVKKG